MKDPFPDISDEKIRERYPHVAGHLTAAYAFVKRYRQEGPDARMQEEELCGLAEAWTFFESAELGLFDNRDAWSLYNAQFILDEVRKERPAGRLDMLLDRSSTAIRALQEGEDPDPEDLAKAESLLYDVIEKITGKPPAYQG